VNKCSAFESEEYFLEWCGMEGKVELYAPMIWGSCFVVVGSLLKAVIVVVSLTQHHHRAM